MPISTFKRNHPIFIKSHSHLFYSSRRRLSSAVDSQHSFTPHRFLNPNRVPPQEPVPNFQDAPISDRIFRDSQKLGSYRRGDSTFYSLIEYHAHSGDFGSLEMVFQRMKRERRAFIEKNFILVFRACGKAHIPHKAVELFDKMVDEFQCKQTVKSLMLGLVSRAVYFFREMPILKCDPDVYTYCTLMDGLCKEDRTDDAMVLLDEMQLEGCCPSPATFNVLINGLCKKGDLARAAKLVENMFLKGCTPNEVTYNTLIHGLCLKGKLDKAVTLLDRMLSDNHIPNDVTYGIIINGLVKQGRAVDGVHVLMALEDRGYNANEYAYSALISGLFKEGKSEEALQLCSLMRGFFQVGNSDKAALVWQQMAEKDYMDNEVCYSVLINGLCKDGKLKDALMVWKHVLAKGYTPDVVAYSSMIHGLCNAGSIKQGLNLFNEMLCKASKSKPDVITYNILLNALCKQDSISQAIHLLNSMLNRGCDPDSVTCKIFLTTLRDKLNPLQDGGEFLDELVLRLHKRQRIDGAHKIIEVMLQSFLHPKASTWEKVVREICKPKKTLAAIGKCWSELFLCCGRHYFFSREGALVWLSRKNIKTRLEVREFEIRFNGVYTVHGNLFKFELYTTEPEQWATMMTRLGTVVINYFPGAWRESASFNKGPRMGLIPKSWKEKCIYRDEFNPEKACNKKIIGARYYKTDFERRYGKINKTKLPEYVSARDVLAHGTHTASTAVGSRAKNSGLFGFARRTARGGAPRARLAVDKVCWNRNFDGICTEEDVLAAFDEMLHDGVHVISASFGKRPPLKAFFQSSSDML
ncbi:hypothetical protein BUALT_Bualt17G0093800 [Buddleja alternifolia]|uniref:Peptidase S8/S53 domain-containing protein n=1 Tax=Buddleja alternifolia TaxID=168488 RepID=A0AAV6WF16_9LAMI|nr:hypothetical protein BUALT_Bualt17G0093800 [Buddleja alternifolia]